MGGEKKSKEACCTSHTPCYCKALAALLIIVLVWWAPSWANIGITVLAALILVGVCPCRGKDK